MLSGIVQTIFVFLAFAAAGASVYFSARQRGADEEQRPLLAAKMNISMGLMLVCIAAIQLFFYFDSWVRIVVGIVFLLLGLVNLVSGLRRYSRFKSR